VAVIDPDHPEPASLVQGETRDVLREDARHDLPEASLGISAAQCIQRCAARGMGAGRAALEAFCQAYAERGFWKIVSRIFPENVASLALHERCGFRVVGVYQRHGKLEGQWRDCVIVERLLDE